MNSSEIPVILNLCYEIEMKMYELYTVFAEKFSSDENIKKLFLKTANEEINHANQFKFAMNLTYKSKINFTTDIEEIKQKLAKIDEILLFSKTMEYNLAEALKNSIQLEKDFAEYHSHKIIQFPEEKSLEQLFNAMMKADKEHVEQLQKALEKLMQSNP
jgi:rubrerythrin